MDYKDLLRQSIPEGLEYALTVKALSDRTGIGQRAVKEYIRQLRVDDGLPIISSADGGYFLPREDSEADEEAAVRFLTMQKNQARNSFLSAKPVMRFLSESRQLAIEGS